MRHTAEDVLAAGLRLRFGVEVVEADLYLPPNAVGPAAVVLLLADDATSDNVDRLAPGLSAGADLVVVRVPARAQLLAALYWVADHTNELGGRPDRLIVAGCDVSGARAAWLAIAARDSGWPVLHRQVLVHPRFTRCCPAPHRVTGVAPATIVSGCAPRDEATKYALLLKRCGVDVCQLRRSAPDDEVRTVADLGRALQQTKGRML
jgi:alpha/beta hydrolase fold